MTNTVTAQTTPNPETLKFLVNSTISQEMLDFESAQSTDRSPLASKIFGFPWTSRVFIGPDFISVTKQDWVDWDVLAEPLAGIIKEHLDSGVPVVLEASPDDDSENSESDEPIVKEIKRALKTYIRPVVALDGGDVVFSSFQNGVLAIKMKGSCAGCPSSTATLKEGIEVKMKEFFPQINEVIGV